MSRLKPTLGPAFRIDPLDSRLYFAFGVTTTSTSYVVDNGANLQFTVLRAGTTSSTIHLGDMTSVKYKCNEMLAPYATTGRYSHYEQGLGSSSAVTATVDPNGQWILVTADDSANSASATQYYAVRKGDDTIYMASLPTDVTAGPGEGRYIAYLNRSVFTNPEAPSDNAGSTGAIEGSDVYGHADGTTSSKFYNMGRRMIENTVHGIVGSAGGSAVGAWMYMGNREHSAGGPFFKDIDFQSGSAVEMYNCLFTGHTQTENFRQGLYTYGMSFNGGAAPAATLDYSWMSALNLNGWIPASQRGTLAGVASGVPVGHEVTVTLSNSAAQYWGTPDSTGKYTISGVQAGTYTETLYDGELAVGTRTVTVTGGQTTNANIADTLYTPSNSIFRIGTWDGTPLGFLDTDADPATGIPKVEIMHPSDVRMADWDSTPNFIVGTNTASQWPAYQFMGVNNSQKITFNLTSAQVQNLTLRIGITWGFSGARPQITVNPGQTYAWTSTYPTASSDLNSRGITRGTWRGDNQVYTFDIPASAFRAGTNTISVPLISGSYTSGQTWLSPNVSYDAIDLTPTTTAYAPSIASVTVTPGGASVGVNGKRTFAAVAKDAAGNVVAANFDWSTALGTIDANGNYLAPASAGTDTISVTATEVQTSGYNTTTKKSTAFSTAITGTGSTTVNVLADEPPTVATPAAANPSPAAATSTALSVLGADNNGEAKLTYTWAATGTPPAPVTFSANGTNAAKSTTATFTKGGTYNFTVTITDASGLTTTSNVSVNVSFGAFTSSSDVGSPSLSGSLSYTSSTGAYTIKAGGADIWGASDQFRYSYTTMAGNGAMVARASSLTNTNSHAKAGVMFRDSSAANAAYAFVTVGPTGTVSFETRSANGVSASYSASATSTLPTYVRLVRSGNTFAAYFSTTGTSWKQVGTTQTVTMASSTLAGLAVTSHNTTTATTAKFDSVAIGTVPAVSSFFVNDGSAQRSMVTSLTVKFNGPVTLASNALTLTRLSDGAGVPLTISTADNTTYTLKFSGTGIVASSLADGVYTLAVNASGVSASGITMTADSSLVFHRLFGDSNGDKTVDLIDSRAFRQALDGVYNESFDYNADGIVDLIDSRQFRSRLDTSLNY